MKLNSCQNEVKSISSYNSDKLEYLLNTDSKKVRRAKKEQNYFPSSKKNIINDSNITNISSIFCEKKIPKNIIQKNIIQKKKLEINLDKNKLRTLVKKPNSSMKKDISKIHTVNIQVNTPNKNYFSNIDKNDKVNKVNSLTKKYTPNNQLITLNKSSKKNNILLSSISITPKKKNIDSNFNYSLKKYNQKSPIQKLNLKNNNINIKNQFSKSMIDNNSLNIYNDGTSKVKDKIKNKRINSSNKNHQKNNVINNIKKINLEENNINNINNNNTNNHNDKILVIDLDETLIHTSFKKIPNPDFQIQLDSTIYSKKKSENNSIEELSIQKIVEAYIRIRPGVNEFLSQLSKYYDLYVYSASSKNYLNNIMKHLDKNNIIKKCYCRDDCIIYVENSEKDFDKPNNKYNYVKDLKKINKDLRNIVFVDNNIMSFKLQEKNGIPIKSFYDDVDDIELFKLIPILKNLSGFYDVRIEIEKFVNNKTFIWSKSINWLKENCLNMAYLNEINFVLKKEQQKSDLILGNNKDINNNNNFSNKNEYNTINNGKKRIIHHINNILINLNDLSNNNLTNKNTTQVVEKNIKSNEKIKDVYYRTNPKSNNKVINPKNNKLLYSGKKKLLHNNIMNTDNNKMMKKEISFYKFSPKNKIKSSTKNVREDKNIIKTILPHQRSLYIPKLNVVKKLDFSQSKKSELKPKQSQSKNKKNDIINKLL